MEDTSTNTNVKSARRYCSNQRGGDADKGKTATDRIPVHVSVVGRFFLLEASCNVERYSMKIGEMAETECPVSKDKTHEWRQKLHGTCHAGYYCIYCLEEVR